MGPPGGILRAQTFCIDAGVVDRRRLFRCAVGADDVLLQGLRPLRLSSGVSPQRKLLAGSDPIVESFQQLRTPLFGPMEHAGALSGVTDLFVVPITLVVG